MTNTAGVHIYSTNIDPERSMIATRDSLLNDEEQARFKRFKFSRHAERWIRSRIALKCVLAAHLDCETAQVTVIAGKNGKPYVSGNTSTAARPVDDEALVPTVSAPLYFNLSHSGNQVVIAVCQRNEVGCDVEWRKPLRDMDAVSRRFFSPREQAALFALEPAERLGAFYNAWTRKEAVIKTTGEGLSATLDAFDVSLTPGDPAKILAHRDPALASTNWHMYSFEPVPEYTAAVTTTGSTAPRFILEDSAVFERAR